MAEEQAEHENYGWWQAPPSSPQFVADFENILHFLLQHCRDERADRHAEDERFFLDNYNAFVRLSRAVQCYVFSCYFGDAPR